LVALVRIDAGVVLAQAFAHRPAKAGRQNSQYPIGRACAAFALVTEASASLTTAAMSRLVIEATGIL
jgi:hypothetical protein